MLLNVQRPEWRISYLTAIDFNDLRLRGLQAFGSSGFSLHVICVHMGECHRDGGGSRSTQI
jgi:hypothetical protein